MGKGGLNKLFGGCRDQGLHSARSAMLVSHTCTCYRDVQAQARTERIWCALQLLCACERRFA
eukprot:760051-Amphidinium_carterae.1